MVPVPSYRPLLDVVGLTGRELVTVPALDADRRLHVAAIDAAFAAGARTLLLSSPHNPLGRVWDRAELEALRDAALRHGARVISDEIHAPLVLPGAAHVPYAALPGTAGHVTTVTAASKAWNVPGLKCAQLIVGTPADLDTLAAAPHVANHGLSPLGLVASVAAYTSGGSWLDGVVVSAGRARAPSSPRCWRSSSPASAGRCPRATYLGWLEVPGGGDPAARARAAGVLVARGPEFGDGFDRFARLTFATSSGRLRRVVERLSSVW